MLHELFIALVGFTGDVIIEENDTFCVNKSLGILTQSELDQLSRIIPLGWIFNQLQSFVTRYEFKWSMATSPSMTQAYTIGMSNGISDILNDYVNDVTFLEQIVSSDGPITLCQVAQHLQKYSLVFPVLHKMCQDIEKNGLRGCQVLEYLAKFNSGIPVLMAAVESVIARINIVFFRQSIGWMVYGRLDDPGKEYFIRSQNNENNSSNSKSSDNAGATGGFNTSFSNNSSSSNSKPTASWNRNFTLDFNYIPNSHITAKQASKILFCGKVTNLLNSSFSSSTSGNNSNNASNSSTTGQSSSYMNNDVYNYLSKTHLDSGLYNNHTAYNRNDSDNDNNRNSSNSNNNNNADNGTSNTIQALIPSVLFSSHDMQRYTLLFEEMIQCTTNHDSILFFTRLIDEIHDKVSNKLWQILCQQYDILTYFQFMRNVYLLGKGEFYQNVLDELLKLTITTSTTDNNDVNYTHSNSGSSNDSRRYSTFGNTENVNVMNSLLKWKVLKSSAKKLNLDDELLTGGIGSNNSSSNTMYGSSGGNGSSHYIGMQLTVDNPNVMISDFYHHMNKCSNDDRNNESFTLYGNYTSIQLLQSSSSSSVGKSDTIIGAVRANDSATAYYSKLSMCNRKTHRTVSEMDQFKNQWEKEVYNKSILSSQQTSNKCNSSTSSTSSVVNNDNNNNITILPSSSYIHSTFCLNESKDIVVPTSHGSFSVSITFQCDWTSVYSTLTANNSIFNHSSHSDVTNPTDATPQKSTIATTANADTPSTTQSAKTIMEKDDVFLGELMMVFDGNKNNFQKSRISSSHVSNNTLGGINISATKIDGNKIIKGRDGSIDVGISFYAKRNLDKVVFYAKLVMVAVPESSQETPYVLNERIIVLHSTGSVSSGIGVTTTGSSTTTAAAVTEVESKPLKTNDLITIDVQYGKQQVDDTDKINDKSSVAAASSSHVNDTLSVASSSSSSLQYNRTLTTNKITFVNVLKVKIYNSDTSNNNTTSAVAEQSFWKLESILDLNDYLSTSSNNNGSCYIGVKTASFIISRSASSDGSDKDSTTQMVDNATSILPDTGNISYDIYCFQYLQSSDGFLFSSFSSSDNKNKSTINRHNHLLVSPFTQAHHIDTAVILTSQVQQFQKWSKLKLSLKMPTTLFCVLFDEDTMGVYQRLFSHLIKIRMVAHGLERLWHKSRSATATQQHSAAGSSQDRYLNHLRQSMHFFISNLFYFLQVDVIDSEFCQFLNYIQSFNHQGNENQNSKNSGNCSGSNQDFLSSSSASSSNHFQKVHKAHKEFLSKMCRLSFIDNISVMDSINKILLICIRYIVICRLKLSQEDQLINNRNHRDSNHSNTTGSASTRKNGSGSISANNNSNNNNIPVIIPIEEFVAIKKDFLTRVEYLFRIMNKLESQNFLFRLDFNGCFINLFNDY